jgi:hypothetical protein
MFKRVLFFSIGVFFLFLGGHIHRSVEQANAQTTRAQICYSAHVSGYGWLAEVCDENWAGTTGQGRQMEAIKIRIVNGPSNLIVIYRVCVQRDRNNIGAGCYWQDWRMNNQVAGTTGQALAIQGLQIGTTWNGGSQSSVALCYQVHQSYGGWLGWVRAQPLALPNNVIGPKVPIVGSPDYSPNPVFNPDARGNGRWLEAFQVTIQVPAQSTTCPTRG